MELICDLCLGGSGRLTTGGDCLLISVVVTVELEATRGGKFLLTGGGGKLDVDFNGVIFGLSFSLLSSISRGSSSESELSTAVIVICSFSIGVEDSTDFKLLFKLAIDSTSLFELEIEMAGFPMEIFGFFAVIGGGIFGFGFNGGGGAFDIVN